MLAKIFRSSTNFVIATVVAMIAISPLTASASFSYGGGESGGGGSSSGGGGGAGGGNLSINQYQDCAKQVSSPNGLSATVTDGTDGNVTVTVNGGDAVRMAVSEYTSFVDAIQSSFATTTQMHLKNDAEGDREIYVRLYNGCGLPSPIVTAKFTHGKSNHGSNGDNNGNSGKTGDDNHGKGGKVLGEHITLVDTLIAKLKYGQRGADVMKLQSELKRLGFLKIGKTTSFYGPMTRAAVNKYLTSLK